MSISKNQIIILVAIIVIILLGFWVKSFTESRTIELCERNIEGEEYYIVTRVRDYDRIILYKRGFFRDDLVAADITSNHEIGYHSTDEEGLVPYRLSREDVLQTCIESLFKSVTMQKNLKVYLKKIEKEQLEYYQNFKCD